MEEFSRKYFDILNNELKGLNLTAIRDYDSFHLKQILDSLLPVTHSKIFTDSINRTKLVIDIGFGGGFPLLPLAKQFPNVKFIGFEARSKKVKAVQLLIDKLNLKNVHVYHKRLEDIDFDVDAVIVNKAVSTVEKFLSLYNYSSNSEIFFYKARNFYDLEGDFLKRLTDFEIIEELEMELSDLDKRILFGIKNKNVPHGTSKNLVKLTNFL
jgi:16S rRNA (guanine527-N7)-methyltransferase